MAQQTKTKLNWRIVVLVTCLEILAAALGIRWYLAHTNVLAHNPKWIVSKSELANPGVDGPTFSNFPPAVADNALNLSAWRGYHGIISQDSFDWSEFSFSFRPQNDGYFYAILDYSEEKFTAVRISFNPLYRSAIVTAKYTGEFTSLQTLPPLPFTDQLWQHFSVHRSEIPTSHYGLWINNSFVTDFPASSSAFRPTQVGFRGGQYPLLIDSIKVLSSDKKTLFTETFDNQEHFLILFGFAAIAILATNRLLFLALQNFPPVLKTYYQLVFVVSFLLVIAGAAGLVVEKPLRDRYPDFNHWWFRLGKGQKTIADTYLANKIEWVFQERSTQKPANVKRIILLGSSQIEGEGVSKPREDVSGQLQKILNQKLTTPTTEWEVVAIGVSGHTAAQLIEPFEHQWLKLEPDVVLLNLSSNDSTYTQGKIASDFVPALEKFIQLAQTHHFKLVFSAEPNSIETRKTLSTHQAMQEVAEKNKVLFLQTHDYIATKTDTGILWWDFVHMTSYGYRLMAEYFFNQLEPILKKL